MKRKKDIGRLIWRILLGTICSLLLVLLLFASQVIVAYNQCYDNAYSELEQIRDMLSSQSHQDELQQSLEKIYRTTLQKAALLLTNQELSNEQLVAVAENQDAASSMMIFGEDDTLLYAYGDAIDDPAFLSKLRVTGQEKAPNDVMYRAIPFRDNLYLAMGLSADYIDLNYRKTQYDMDLVSQLASGMTNKVVVVGRYTQRVLYGLENMIGKKLGNFLISPLEDIPIIQMMDYEDTILLMVALEDQDYLLLSLFDPAELARSMDTAITPALLGFGFLIFLLLIYVRFIRTDMRLGRLGKIHYVQMGKKHYLNTMLLRKLVGFAVVGITCITCIVYCLQLLIRSDEQRQSAENRMDIAVRVLEESQQNMQSLEKQDRERLIDTSREVRSMLDFNPELLSEEGLNSLSRLFGFNDIYVLSDAGKTIATNSDQQTFALSNDAKESTYSFWDIINGFTESHVQIVANDPLSNDQDMLYAGIANSNDDGMILLTFSYDSIKDWHQAYSVETALQKVGIDSQSILLAVSAGSTTCVFDSSNRYTGLSLSEYGLSEAFLRNGYSGTHKFDGKNCLISARSVSGWNLLYITPTSWISATSWIVTAMVILVGILVVITTVLPWLVVRTPGDDIRIRVPKAQSASHRAHVEAFLNRDGEIELVESKVEHHTLNKRWRRMNSSDKLIHLIRILSLIFVCCLLGFLMFGLEDESHPLIDHILEQNWDKSLNVYAFSYVLITVSGIWIVAKLLQTITLFVTGTFSRRWKTLGILISNIIRYAALITSIFFSLQNFGVETSALITSASVLTLVFGLGCQSFVADMVAGVFLIFEGTFRVGDIVTVDNWRGEVVEIGLRSTSVKNELGNVKVFQNSRISGAINMTRDITYAVCDIILPPGEPLEAYEQKLTDEFFPLARESIQTIRHPLVYEGVVAMNGDSATLRISVKCLESQREQLRRELYRALKLWREQR